MNELTTLRKQVKAQAKVLQEQEVTIAEQQADNLRLRSRIVAKRRQARLSAKPKRKAKKHA